MMNVGLKITNKERLIRRLEVLAPGVRFEVSDASLKGAEEIAELARRFVPVRTGKLKASIKAEKKRDTTGARVVAGDENTEVRAGSGVKWNYARGVEFGTKKHRNKGKFAGSMHPGSKPRPYLFPASRMLKKKVQSRISRALGKAARKVAAK